MKIRGKRGARAYAQFEPTLKIRGDKRFHVNFRHWITGFLSRKRSLSAVITAILMILLVMISIGIIWFAIRGMLTDVSDEIQTGVSKVVLNIVDGSVKTNSVDESGNPAVSFKVSRDVGEGELDKIRFVLETDEKKSVELPAENFNQLDERTFYVPLNDMVFLKSISIAPILKTESGKDYLGQITDTYKFTDKEKKLFFKNYGLVSWWNMDSNVLDEISGNNCKFFGNSNYNQGVIGKAVVFNGNNYINCTGGNFGTGEFSIGLWLKFPINGNHILGWESIISKGYSTTPPPNIWGIVRKGTDKNKIVFQDVSGGTTVYDNLDSGDISDGWHYISVTRQGTNVSLYVDGKVVDSAIKSPVASLTNNFDLKMGSSEDISRKFIGEMDEAVIFDKALSEKEIKALYDFGSE